MYDDHLENPKELTVINYESPPPSKQTNLVFSHQ